MIAPSYGRPSCARSRPLAPWCRRAGPVAAAPASDRAHFFSDAGSDRSSPDSRRKSCACTVSSVTFSCFPMPSVLRIHSVLASLRLGQSLTGRPYSRFNKSARRLSSFPREEPGPAVPSARTSKKLFFRLAHDGLGRAGSSSKASRASAACRPSGVRSAGGTAFLLFAGRYATRCKETSLTTARSSTSVSAFPDQRCSSRGADPCADSPSSAPLCPRSRSEPEPSPQSG